ncbi:MAG: leucine-rich repeat protein, partial [Schaalia georgiae]|nr:leucine-rich repeat protein [Schaalia georgiae]
MTSLTLDQSSLSLVPGQNAKLGVSHEPAEANMTDVTWSSSDQAVATVSDSGVVTGVGQGEADIVVASAADPAVSATAHVKVAPVSDETGIALSDSPIIIPTSGQAGVSALLAPSLRGSSVTWALDVEGASIQPSADTLSATITAGDRSARGTVTATVATPAGDKTATAPVEVHQGDYDDFVIDADGVLTQYRGSGSTISVPDTVTAIADEALRGVNAERITIPATVRTIGNRAFADARRLTTVVFEDTAAHPSQLTELGGALVDNDYSLDEIILPSKVVKLGGGAFSNSTIKRLSLPDSLTAIPSDLAERSSQLNEVTIGDAVTQIGASAFSENTSLGELRIRQADGSTKAGLPSALTTIGASAFSGTRFASLDLPASVSAIGDSAFMKAPLTHLGLNKGLVSVGEQAFSGTLLTEVELPDSVTTVGKGAFKAMPELTKAHLGPNVAPDQLVSAFTLSPKLSSITVDSANASYESVDGVLYTKDHTHLVAYPMAKNSGGSYTVVDGTARIDDEAFQQAPLRQISFPASLRSIGVCAFANAQLTDVVLPDQFETLEAHAFQSTANLASANLGGTVTIGDSAFDSSSLTSVDFRTDLNRLETVGSMAFSGAPVRVLVFPDSLKSVGAFAFENNPHLEEVHIGAALTDLDTGFLTGSDALRTLTVSADNPVYSAENNVLYAKQQDGTHLVLRVQ